MKEIGIALGRSLYVYVCLCMSMSVASSIEIDVNIANYHFIYNGVVLNGNIYIYI